MTLHNKKSIIMGYIMHFSYTGSGHPMGSNMTVAFVFIDTIILAMKSDPKNMYFSPDGPDSQQAVDR